MQESHVELVSHQQETQQMLRDFREELVTIYRMALEPGSNDTSLHQAGGRSLDPRLTSSSSRARDDRAIPSLMANTAATSYANGFSGYYSGHCVPNCRCQCHKTTVSITRLVLNSLLGRSQPRVTCDEPTCRHLQRLSFTMLRSFRQITAELWIEGQSLTHVSLRMPRVVDHNDLLWLQDATLDDVRLKLSTRELTVNDVRPNGESVLHVSASLSRF